MKDSVYCDEHGHSRPTFVCQHLANGTGLGFYFASDPGNARPDAWCQDCEKILVRVGEWNDESEAFAGVKLICSNCYDEIKSRNCDRYFKFLCSSCSEIHYGVPAYGWPHPVHYYDVPESERGARIESTEDTCIIDKEFFFVRGNLEIPVIDASESLSFGVWVSLSKANFDKYVDIWESEDRVKESPMFGWLSTSIKGYPNTVNLKTMVHIQPPGIRARIELEPTEHPLAIQQREGIFMKSLREIYDHIAPGQVNASD